MESEAADYLQQVFYLFWSEEGGRLIEDEDFRVAVEHFQDFGPLLLCHWGRFSLTHIAAGSWLW